MSKSNMKSDTDEDYRLEYVAFMRAKGLIVLACLETVDTTRIKKAVNSEIV